MEIIKSGHEAIIKYDGFILTLKPTLLNWNPIDLHRVTINNDDGMVFMWLQNSPHDMHNTIALDKISSNKAIDIILKAQEKLTDLMRFEQRHSFEFASKLLEMVNI